LLTVVDIRAVGPKVWNGWKATLLRELYHRAAELMAGGLVEEARSQRIAAAQAAVKQLLADFKPEEFESFIAKGYPFYWLSFEPEIMARHARLIRAAERDGKLLTVETRVDPGRAVTEVTLYTTDHAGLFSRIAGALAIAGANIVDAKILTMQNGMALDTFTVQGQADGAFDQPERLARLKATFEGVLSGAIKVHVELARQPAIPARTRTLAVPPRVIVNNNASRTHTVIEVNGRDRAGLLFQVTRALTALNLQISSAKISTYGEKVVDVFYVKDLFGHKIEDETRLKNIREGLLGAFTEESAQNPTVAAE
ncbi:MAG: [protein-PII] uridylyltransferase, partial [Stellaceae bacterium]